MPCGRRLIFLVDLFVVQYTGAQALLSDSPLAVVSQAGNTLVKN